MRSKVSSNKGFTLIEIIFYISITVLMITIFSDFVSDLLKTTDRISNTNKVQSISRFIVGRITQEIKTENQISAVQPRELTLISQSGQSLRFYYDSAEKSVRLEDGANNQRLSDENVSVNSLTFSQVNDGVNVQAEVQSISKKNGGAFKFVLSSLAIPRQKIYYDE